MFFQPLFVATNATEKSIPGWDHAYVWQENSLWFAIGARGSLLVFIGGWGSDTPPDNPFAGGWMVKTPSDKNADEDDVEGLLKAQGAKFAGGIPAFDFIPIVVSVMMLMSIIFLLRKNQLSLIKTY